MYVSVSQDKNPILQVNSTKSLRFSLAFSLATEGKQEGTSLTLALSPWFFFYFLNDRQ